MKSSYQKSTLEPQDQPTELDELNVQTERERQADRTGMIDASILKLAHKKALSLKNRTKRRRQLKYLALLFLLAAAGGIVFYLDPDDLYKMLFG
jgi:hypothetical protein